MANYQKEMETAMRAIAPGTPLLLHACCGPCASSVLERLCGHFAVTVYYYNPNIQPPEEYQRRLAALQLLPAQIKTAYPVALLEGPYEEAAFAAAAAGLESEPEGGARCAACFGVRLGETAQVAKENGFAWYCSTLSVSPHKNAALINETGQKMAAAHGVRFLPSDFKKQNGYQRSIELSRQYGLYRQDYCGCLFSK